MLGYQVDEVAAALRMPLSFDPTMLMKIAVYKKRKQFKLKSRKFPCRGFDGYVVV